MFPKSTSLFKNLIFITFILSGVNAISANSENKSILSDKFENINFTGDGAITIIEEIDVKQFSSEYLQDNIRTAARKAYYEAESLRKQEFVELIPVAIGKLENALRLFQSIDDKHGIALTHNELALCYSHIQNYETALKHADEASLLWRSNKDESNEGVALTQKGYIYVHLSEYQKALDNLNNALRLKRKTNHIHGEAFTLQSLGLLYLELGEYQEALKNFQNGLSLFQQTNDKIGLASSLNNIGFTHYLLGKNKDALSNFNAALVESKQANYKRAEIYVRNNIARIFNDEGHKKEALDNYQKSLNLSRSIGEGRIEGIILCNIGSVYLNYEDVQKSITYLTQAVHLQNRIKHKAGVGRSLGLLMTVWNKLKKPKLAIFYGKQAVNTFQEIRTNIQSLDKKLQKNFLLSKQDIYRELAELLIVNKRLPEAQQVLDMLKEEEYAEFITRSVNASALSARSQLTPRESEINAVLQQLEDELAAIGKEYGELRYKKNRSEAENQRLNELVAKLTEANQRFQNFLDQLLAEFGGDADARDRIFNIKEHQSLMETLRILGPKVVALYTIVLKDKYRVIVVTPDVQIPREFPITEADLSRKIMLFLSELRDPKQNPLSKAKELYKILMDPVIKDLEAVGAETIMWSLDDVLRYVPIAALHDGNNYLVTRFSNVVYTPASRDNLREKRLNEWRGVGLGISKAFEDFEELSFVPVELSGIIREDNDIGGSIGVIPGRRILDDDFTEENLRNALLQNEYQLIHIASHFKLQPGNELESYLLLGKGGRLTVSQIKTMPNFFAGVDLLTLSACNTGVTVPGADGKELEGFAVLAQRQGARGVIASLWKVADSSTSALMLRFYGLLGGEQKPTKAQALQKAQLALLNKEIKATEESGKDYSHPFFWAPFVLIGNWN